jgi:hypothetical protein
MNAYSIIKRFTDLREQVRDRLRKVNTATEHGTLEAGRQLHRVVETGRAHISKLRDMLLGATDSTLQRAITSHADHVRLHGAKLDRAVATHAVEVQSVAETARQIKAAAQEIERANSAARVLSINARIESARSGAHVFKAIAIEMHDLSRAIVAANGRVQQLASAIEVTLPRLAEQSLQLREMVAAYTNETRSQIDQVDKEVVALRDSAQSSLQITDEALATIIAASHAGLSALQFQDVCAQSLLQIDAWQAVALKEAATALGVEIDIEEPPVAISEENTILDDGRSGNVMLF